MRTLTIAAMTIEEYRTAIKDINPKADSIASVDMQTVVQIDRNGDTFKIADPIEDVINGFAGEDWDEVTYTLLIDASHKYLYPTPEEIANE